MQHVYKASSNSSLVNTKRGRHWGILWSVILRSRRQGGLVHCHFLIYLLQIQVFKIHAGGVLDKVSPEELKTLVIPTEEHSVVLFSLLEGLDRLSNNSLDLLFCSQELLVFLQRQPPLCPQIIKQDLGFFLGGVSLIHGGNKVLPQL